MYGLGYQSRGAPCRGRLHSVKCRARLARGQRLAGCPEWAAAWAARAADHMPCMHGLLFQAHYWKDAAGIYLKTIVISDMHLDLYCIDLCIASPHEFQVHEESASFNTISIAICAYIA